MYKKHYEESKLQLSIEFTSFCNARCPQCSRTNEKNNLKVHEWLPLKHWSYEQFVKRLGEDVKHVRSINLCGNYGDPGMNPDLDKCIRWVMDNSNSIVQIHTNMAMRSPKFWKELADYCGKRLIIICAIDGITDEMHQHYRRGCPLDKVVANFKAAASARRRTLTVFFEHNWPYKDEILEFCRQLGADDAQYLESNRFHSGDEYYFQDEDGNPQTYRRIPQDNKVERFETNIIATSRCRNDKGIREERLKQDKNVTCRKEKVGSLFLNLDGFIYPCCHLGGNFSNMTTRDKPVWDSYIDGFWSLDATSIKDFVYSEWLEELDVSLKEDPMTVCKIKCGDYGNTLTEDD